ncbi:prefoldin, alpha subunit [Methanohalobium evestigatum Z-7303]|uniref:Prefoldin subunit alpha n=1 Tax=Methanohalobium evestigatum (strain ATCC BAA-1072 / DSM 3721 / NBRC 107634 / OCM 161 / Z-7303) TaxID=644295 RepID=D7E709_METEZ|nr:prefoldin subunit alpha [Methanohalobium evestigatum]ADI73633.1 prefoldin, alpha subunit [Methanohalobium evestigatum Z-7303]
MSDGASGKGDTEQYFRQLSTQYQQYKNQLESIKQHIDMVYTSSEECVKALNTIESLESLEEGTESMVPIGSGTYMHAQFNDLNRFVIDIGAGISVEKNREDAKETLNKRKEEMDNAYERLNESYSQVVQNMQEIERQFNEYQSKMQSQQDGAYRAQ